MSGKTCLISGEPLDGAAGEKEAIAKGVGLVGFEDIAAGLFDLGKGRLRGEHNHRSVRQQYAALVWPFRVEIDERSCEAGLCSGPGDASNNFGETTTMIGMPMREKYGLDPDKIGSEPLRVFEPQARIGPDVEQHCMFDAVAAARQQYGKAVTAAAELVEHGLAFVPFILAARRRSGSEMHDLRDLRYTIVDARQGIRLVVDNNEDFQFVKLDNTFRT